MRRLVRFMRVRGTPTYLAPEVCKGEGATASSPLRPRPSTRLGRELPPAFKAVIVRCLAKDPADRFASARGLRRALEACDGLLSWTPEDARGFWEHERKALVRRWTDNTVA